MTRLISRQPSETLSPVVADMPDMHPVLLRVLANRGVQNAQELDYRLADLLPFHTLKGLEQAVALLVPVITKQKRLLIVGDFDVDGATSTALSLRALTMMGAKNISYLVPNRFDFGYGLSPELVEVARQSQPMLSL